MANKKKDFSAYRYILVDERNIAHRMAAKLSALSHQGRPSGLFFGFIKHILMFYNNGFTGNVVICRDSPDTFKRQQNFGYKGSRGTVKSSLFDEQLMSLIRFFSKTKVSYAAAPMYEADDVAYTLLKDFKEFRSGRVLLSTNDSDWHFYVNSNVDFFDGDFVLTEPQVEMMYGFPLRKLILFKTFNGNRHNDVDGVMPVREAVELTKSIEHDALDFDSLIQSCDHEIFTDVQKMRQINYLVKPQTCFPTLHKGEPDFGAAVSVLAEYGVKSLIENAAVLCK